MKNSMYLERNEAAIVINQKNFTQVYLSQTLKSLIINPEIRKSLSENILKLKKKNVTKNICDQIIKEMD
jgi:UDP-N-acetylglucosamine:LPS N-acetylglucosamine transferase